MRKRNVETYYEAGVWKNRVQGTERAANATPMQAAALLRGRAMAAARGGAQIIKDRSGKIRQWNTQPETRDPRRGKGETRAKDLLAGGTTAADRWC